MNEENMQKEIIIIKEVFDEERKILGFAPPEMTDIKKNCYKGGDIFITENGELIDLEYQINDFDEKELVKYIELAEELYNINNVSISIYVLCPDTVKILTPECTIPSEASFNIKLACFAGSPIYDILYHIKEKIDKNICISNEDIHTLFMIPLYCPEKDRKNLRIECLRLLNRALK